MTQRDRAAAFRRLHQREAGAILVLPNAWDVMSARLVEEAGARAIATTSAGISWSLGRPDGQGLSRTEMLDAVRRIASAVRLPVTADVEGGYGKGTPDEVAETVRGVLAAGAVGVNLEDALGQSGQPLRTADDQAMRISAARAAAKAEGVDLFINARVDVYLMEVGAPETRFDEAIRRARAYVAAGADGVFVPGVIDAPTIRRLAGAVGAPLNILAKPGAPSAGELHELGVARVSAGSGITSAAMALIRRAAVELLGPGTYETLRGGVSHADANALMSRVAKS
jgi:2-methylisocitrate lyase-like PEP mutase family enzyme